MQRVIISSGYWASNIGNAFYDLGAKYVLEKCLGNRASIRLSSDKPGVYWEYFFPSNCSVLDHTEQYDADYLVLLGPVFSPSFIRLWINTLKRLQERGTRIVFMSAGANEYDDQEYDEISRLLDGLNLYSLMSRDSETYQRYNSFFEESYDGICCAFYCNEYAPKFTSNSTPYIVMNYDNGIEPFITESTDNARFELNGKKYDLIEPKGRRRRAYIDKMESGELIVRTIHSVLPPYIQDKRDHKTNCFVSDIPFDYLHLYSNADAVITNRVHAAVASVAYGTPTYLANNSPRANILKRVGCEKVFETISICDNTIIDNEKKKLESEIERVFV